MLNNLVERLRAPIPRIEATDVGRWIQKDTYHLKEFGQLSPEKMELATTLIMAFVGGMDQEFTQYEKRNLKFTRAKFELLFLVDEENDWFRFNPRRNLITVSFRSVMFDVLALLKANSPKLTTEKINRYRLWGGEEANHSVYSQFKKGEFPLQNPYGDEVKHVIPDQEFWALRANIRQAKRENMPQSMIDEMQELLEKARAARMEKHATRH